MSDTDKLRPVLAVISTDHEAIAPPSSSGTGAALAPAEPVGGGSSPSTSSGDELPADAPVKPLGTRDGSFAYLNPLGEFRELTAGRHNRLELEGLFASQIDFLERDFARMSAPRGKQEPRALGIEWDRVSKACMNSCARRGVFDDQQLRGRGAWRGDQGELVYHAGDCIFRGSQEAPPGVIGGFIYARAATLPHPWPTATPGGELGPASMLLKAIGTWPWGDATLEPLIVLGWACIAMVGGAAPWRPMLGITGSHGSGKSHLLDLLDHFFAGAALFVTDSSAAGLAQWIRHQTLPVMVAEFENAADSRRAQEVLAIVRQAASGGRRVRGGADHQGVDFTLRSAFAYAGINLPIMSAADRSRVAVVELTSLPSGVAPALVPRKLREIGRQILRRMVDNWGRYDETAGVYRAALLSAGLTARSADLYAALLSGADLALHDGAPDSDFVDEIVQRLKPRIALEYADAQPDGQDCLSHLLTALLPPDGPNKRAIAELIATVCNDSAYPETRTEAGQLLERHGVKVRHQQLAIANRHAQLVKVFAGTRWGGRADTTNGWVQSLRRVAGAEPLEGVRFAGVKARATGIPLSMAMLQGDAPSTTTGESEGA